jgi:cytochrome c peroxidase
MLDGKHISLQDQAEAVMTSPLEMANNRDKIAEKVMSCEQYKDLMTQLAKSTPQAPKPGLEHIVSALTTYYGKFSNSYSPFDRAILREEKLNTTAIAGFNLFMGKAQCATCHFVPQFNGVKPPFIGSEFEVLGVPGDTGFHTLSPDPGRFEVFPAAETFRAFRTGSLRNIAQTGPYMHNGVFRTLREVIVFYNDGGGAGRGLDVPNQTLSTDPLGLSEEEMDQLIAFMESLTESVPFEAPPDALPVSKVKKWNTRVVSGVY